MSTPKEEGKKERKTLLHINTVTRVDPNTRSMRQLKIIALLALNQMLSLRSTKFRTPPNPE